MTADDLVIGQEYVVSIDVAKEGHEEHPQLDPGDLVVCVNPVPDGDGEVYVTATASQDGAAIGAWVLPQYLWTVEQAEQFVKDNPEIARVAHGFHSHDEDDEDDGVDEGLRTWEYVPHPDFPNLPTYETLPLGYALGIVQYIKDLGKPALTPEQQLFTQYLQSRGFPTG